MSRVLAYGSKGIDARRVLVYGNCQSPYLARLLSGIEGLNDDYQFVYVPNHAAPGEDIAELPDWCFENVALLIEQHDDRAAVPVREHMRSRLKAGCRKITHPTFLLASLWPFECPDPRSRPEADLLWGRYPHGDMIGLKVAEMGLHGDAAVDAYLSLSARKMPDLMVRLQRDVDRMRHYDRCCDIALADYVLDRFRREHTFWTWGHTATAPLAELTQRLWAAAQPVIGGNAQEAERGIGRIASQFDGIGELQLPIHPMVAAALDLTFWSPDKRYRWYGQRWTFHEYIAHYISYDTGWSAVQ
ncbi:WcbI family polysaccharide biosynthesis putative acetyltransferase [Plastoroseomonas hellenica]|uniref:WcbI family polysaccharide biosynthesis putative acetyltransferase n=1 Tax=Plastoroseomonas hellenica TaxID=2687306 RepID=UPI001BA5243B|nr:hypothetical protein [Plastoroseomonas hellenica]